MKETDLYNLLETFLKWKSPNARIFTELDDRDVVIFEDLASDNQTYVSELELKLSLNKELLKQMCNRDRWRRGHYLYAVVPVNKRGQEKDLYHLFEQMGWGLIEVNMQLVLQYRDYPMRYCEVVVQPKLAPKVMRVHQEPIESALFTDIQNQAGGSVGTVKFTGFKADLENVYFALKGLKRPRSWRATKSLLKNQGIDMADHTVQHRLKCLRVWGVIEVTKRGRTSLYKCICNDDEIVASKILLGSKKRVK